MREMETDDSDGMYVYLPAVKRMRQVRGGFSGGALMGTSFNYSDFRLLQNSFDKGMVNLAGNESVQQRPSHKLVLMSKESDLRQYSQMTLWVDQISCVVLKGEFLSNGILRKALTTPAVALKKPSEGW